MSFEKLLLVYLGFIFGFVMVVCGEIGYFILLLVEGGGVFRNVVKCVVVVEDELLEIFLIIIWVIIFCMIVGLVMMGLLVDRVRCLECGILRNG